jgi:hypothetical protein
MAPWRQSKRWKSRTQPETTPDDERLRRRLNQPPPSTTRDERMTVEIHPTLSTGGRTGLPGPGGCISNHGHDMKTAVAATDVLLDSPGARSSPATATGSFLAGLQRDPTQWRWRRKCEPGCKQASLAFTSSATTPGLRVTMPYEVHRQIMEMGHIHDVCAATQGVLPQTFRSSGILEVAGAARLGHRRRTDWWATPYRSAGDVGHHRRWSSA